MKIVYLETTAPGLRWMRRYYQEQPQLNSDRVFSNFDAAKDRLREEPFAGHPFDDFDQVRELSISRSPFTILYTHRDDTIYIIDIRDTRGLRNADALADFTQRLRQKYRL